MSNYQKEIRNAFARLMSNSFWDPAGRLDVAQSHVFLLMEFWKYIMILLYKSED